MAGEARKAAERAIAKEWREKTLFKYPPGTSYPFTASTHQLDEWLAEYAAETREQCAQIADTFSEFIDTLPESNEPIAAFGKDLTKRVAAAIRSIAQQDSANEGEDK